MTTAIIWENSDKNDYSIEYFNPISETDLNILKGTVILLVEKNPRLVTYEIICDKYWKTRSVKINQQTSDSKNRYIDLIIDRDQIWRKILENCHLILLQSWIFLPVYTMLIFKLYQRRILYL